MSAFSQSNRAMAMPCLISRSRRALAATLNPRHFQRDGIGRADVFETAELLDDRAVEPFLGMHEREANSFLRSHLPDGDKDRHRNDGQHDETDAPFCQNAGGQRESGVQHRRDEVGEGDFEKFHEAFDAARDAAMQ